MKGQIQDLKKKGAVSADEITMLLDKVEALEQVPTALLHQLFSPSSPPLLFLPFWSRLHFLASTHPSLPLTDWQTD